MIALFRKSTLAGSMMIEASGSRLLLTRCSTPCPSQSVTLLTIGSMILKPKIAIAAPMMPMLKLSISISNPGLTFPSMAWSKSFSRYADRGPRMNAPRIITWPPNSAITVPGATASPPETPLFTVTSVVAPTMAPNVATAPMTAPR